jgi:hypothetical protein
MYEHRHEEAFVYRVRTLDGTAAMIASPQAIPSELKTCELCGRLFVRPTDPGREIVKGVWVANAKQRDCAECIAHPPEIKDDIYIHRSYRLLGVKI